MNYLAFIYKDAKIRMYLFLVLFLMGAFQLSANTRTNTPVTNTEPSDRVSSTTINIEEPTHSLNNEHKRDRLSEADEMSADAVVVNLNLGCNDNVTTLFSDDCTVLITSDMILEGSYPPTLSENDFILRVIGDDANEANEVEDNIVNDAGRFEVVVLPRNPATFPIRDWTGCWGYITVEDKRRPQLINEYEEELFKVKRTLKKQQFFGDVGMLAKEGMLNMNNYTCFSENTPTQSCERPYKTLPFQVNQSGMYILELDAEGGEDGMLALFRETFNPNAPCENIIQQSNQRNEYRTNIIQEVNSDDVGLVRMAVQLDAGRTYVALVSLEECRTNPLNRQPFKLNLYAESNGRALYGFGGQSEVEVYRELFCNDVNFIWNNPASANMLAGDLGLGAPAFEDCSMSRVWFEDDEVVDDGDCEGIYFIRHWFAEDVNGRVTSESQIIRLRRPAMSDIFRPAKTELASFDEMTPGNLDEQGNPSPSITGYPFVMSAFGKQELDGVYCNVGASYTDITEFEVCTGVKKIIRQWTLLNWCDAPDQFGDNEGMLVNYQQVIKVGDVEPPEMLSMTEQVVSTGLFDCLAEWRVPPPQFRTPCDDCDINITIHKLIEQPVFDNYGRETGEYDIQEDLVRRAEIGDVITQLEQGYRYRARYTAIDDCGNQSEPVDLYFQVKDETEPVAICNGSLNVSVDGQGFARISADDVDEGSWDNCGEVSLYISRLLANEDIRNSYLFHVYNLTFSALVRTVVDGPHGETEVWKKISDGLPVLRKKDGIWYTWWHPEVFILCQDIESQLLVEMLVVDGEGSVEGFWNGLYNGNLCWLDVNVENKLAPTCVAPADVQLSCNDLPAGFDPDNDQQLEDFFGFASMYDNCAGGVISQTRKVISWDCGAGSIIRFFQAENATGMQSANTCRQVITVTPSHDYEIRFPKDITFDCSDQQPDTIAVVENGCDLLTINVKDEKFGAEGNACYMLHRTYQVINWCEYDGEAAPVTIRRDMDCDGVDGEQDIYVLVRGDNMTYIDTDNNEGISPAVSSCGNGARGHLTNSNINQELASVGYWKYTQYIEISDNTAPEIRLAGENTFCSYSNDCLGDIDMSMTIEDICGGEDIDIEIYFLADPETGLASRINLDNDYNKRLYEFQVEGTMPFLKMRGSFPIGNHQFEIHASDGCGNQALKRIDFSVLDCKSPEPICINGLSIPLQALSVPSDVDGDGDIDRAMAVISASDFKISGMTDCSGPIRHSINLVGQVPDPNRTNLILTCDDVDTMLVEIFVWDSAYNPNLEQPNGTIGGPNYASCLTYVVIQNSQFDLCSEGAEAGVAGLIITEENETIEEVEVHLSGKMSETQMTPADGLYSFMDLPSGFDYSITPTKKNDYLNGVTTFDLVKITRHVLGTEKLDSPYKMIAADVNSTGTLTTLDLVHLRKLILGLRKELPNTNSWRFLPADYRFPNPENPWSESFPEVMNFNNINEVMTQGDFIALKVGDVNGNAKANRFSSDERSLAGKFYLSLEEQELEAGEEYRVDFTAKDLADIQGYQFTLHFDQEALDLVEMEYGLAKEENFGMIYLDEGKITTSWNQEEMGSGKSEIGNDRRASRTEGRDRKSEVLFTLVFRAEKDARLSELLQISSQYTLAEAYNTADEMLDVALQFEEEKLVSDQAELYQNWPNPFTESTQIGFYLPEAAEATLTIHDLNGRALQVIRGYYDQGKHQLSLDRQDFPVALGVLFYTLETGTFTSTKKMLVID